MFINTGAADDVASEAPRQVIPSLIAALARLWNIHCPSVIERGRLVQKGV